MLPPKDVSSSSEPAKNTMYQPTNKPDILELADEQEGEAEDGGRVDMSEDTNDTLVSSCSDLGYSSHESSLSLQCQREVFHPGCPGELGTHAASDSMVCAQGVADHQGLPPYCVLSHQPEDDPAGDADNPRLHSLESVLSQFATFFRGRLELELRTFEERMEAMAGEQQAHVRRIVSSISQQMDEETSSQLIHLDPVSSNIDDHQMNDSHSCAHEETAANARTNLVTELLSLSCQLSALLNMTKFSSE